MIPDPRTKEAAQCPIVTLTHCTVGTKPRQLPTPRPLSQRPYHACFTVVCGRGFADDLVLWPCWNCYEKQKPKSLLPGLSARGTGWVATGPRAGRSGLAQAWDQGSTLPSPNQGMTLGNRQWEGSDVKAAIPLLLTAQQAGGGRGNPGKWSWLAFGQG